MWWLIFCALHAGEVVDEFVKIGGSKPLGYVYNEASLEPYGQFKKVGEFPYLVFSGYKESIVYHTLIDPKFTIIPDRLVKDFKESPLRFFKSIPVPLKGGRKISDKHMRLNWHLNQVEQIYIYPQVTLFRGHNCYNKSVLKPLIIKLNAPIESLDIHYQGIFQGENYDLNRERRNMVPSESVNLNLHCKFKAIVNGKEFESVIPQDSVGPGWQTFRYEEEVPPSLILPIIGSSPNFCA